MKLLITTQAIDKNDPILGFFHRWVEEFAKHFDVVHVVCLKEGEHQLPAHVHVHSLGKEEGENRLKYIWRFYRYMWAERNEYDIVFSHMNPHYIVLAGWYWKFNSKRILFWRNHARINVMTYIAAWYSKHVFYTSQYACTTRFNHSVRMPVGIDTEYFKPDTMQAPKSKTVLFLGRLSEVKRPKLFLEAVRELQDFSVSVYGEEPDGNGEYAKSLMEMAGSNTHFFGSVRNADTPKIYSAHEIYVNLTPKGSMDKTILEAASCGSLILVSNDTFREMLDPDMYLGDSSCHSIRKHIESLHARSEQEKNRLRGELRKFVEDNHSLKRLAELLHTYARS